MSSAERAPPPPLIRLDPAIDPTAADFREGTLSHPPNYGYPEGVQRKERVMIATLEEMESAKVPPKFRDYCAHKWIMFEKCKRDKFPFVYRCHHEKHDYDHCQLDDYIIRMKEMERERRLLHRKQRKARKAAEAAGAEE
jgi:NADH dehydrogenase (ubiquinone) 1 beta subcomplex subunit 7